MDRLPMREELKFASTDGGELSVVTMILEATLSGVL